MHDVVDHAIQDTLYDQASDTFHDAIDNDLSLKQAALPLAGLSF
jgi:hypothetical protein